ncbi:MAG: hypothetical protein J6Y57_00975 [Lachnospiraceae bacterium]|nr:hypothetical protein [Lachnospiraceae bacterium]
MVEAFRTINLKNGNSETWYAVTGKFKSRTEVLKLVATYKKESLERVKAKFKKIIPGYMLKKGKMIELYEQDKGEKLPNGATPCMIVRR